MTSYADTQAASRPAMKHGARPGHKHVSLDLFTVACQIAGVPATLRQLSKYRNEHGAAFAKKQIALAHLRAKARSAKKEVKP